MPRIGAFTASDGYRQCFRHWPASGTRRGTIVALHGIQSHSGWYEYSCGRLAEAGWEVWFLDRRGSGMNDQARGHTPDAERLVSDVIEFLRESRNEDASVGPTVLLAVSWGGKLAAVTTARGATHASHVGEPGDTGASAPLVDAVALLYPGICARIQPNGMQRRALRLAQQWGLGGRPVAIPLDDPAMFTSDAGWREFIRHDPLALRKVTVSFLNASVKLDREAQSAAAKISCPVLLLLAGGDRIIDNDATSLWLGKVTGPVRSKVYPQAEHTLEFEACRDEFIGDLVAWLNELQPSKSPISPEIGFRAINPKSGDLGHDA